MKKNTVTISLEDYNRLRDFKIGIEEGNTYTIYNGWHSQQKFIGTDNALNEMSEHINILDKKIYDLGNEKKDVIYKFKAMSLWSIIKWKLGVTELKLNKPS